MGACPTLETERLIMRPFRESDLEQYRRVLSAGPVRESLHLPDKMTTEDVWQRMALFLGQWELRNHGQWALEEKVTGSFVGRAGLHCPERADWPGIEVGWALHPDYWGRGYASEAGRASVDWAFANHDVDALYSIILPTNEPSMAVARRLGFELLEERVLAFFPLKKHGVWQLPRDRWTTRRGAGGQAET